jgi:hypothetical protein
MRKAGKRLLFDVKLTSTNVAPTAGPDPEWTSTPSETIGFAMTR